MGLIRELVQHSLTIGCLSVEAEEQLRQLLKTKYGLEDLDAFIDLQQAVIEGKVKQKSRDLKRCFQFSACQSTAVTLEQSWQLNPRVFEPLSA